jgi:hypothetical protein
VRGPRVYCRRGTRQSVGATGRRDASPHRRGLIEGYPLIDEVKLRDASRVPAAIDAVTRAIARQFGASPVKSRITALVASAIA